MTLDVGIVYPLWCDRTGSDNLFDRVAGEVGLEHVTIPAVTGPIEQICCAGTQEWRYFQSEGGWHYHADAKRYDNTRLRPKAARWLSSRDVLSQVCERAAGRDVRVLFRVEPRRIGYLLDHHAQIRMKNAWGDELPAQGACPSNPDLRALFRSTLDELAALGASGFEIEDWMIDRPVGIDRSRAWDWHPAARALLDVCFCESCRQIAVGADVDPDLAARSVQVHMGRLASQPPTASDNDAIEDDEVLAAYRAARSADLRDWLVQVGEKHAARQRFRLTEAVGDREVADDAGWAALGRARPPGDAPTVESDRDAPTFESDVAGYVRAAPRPAALCLPLWRPLVAEAGDLVRLVNDAVVAGARFFDFEGLHEAAPEALVWLRQAVRFARRA